MKRHQRRPVLDINSESLSNNSNKTLSNSVGQLKQNNDVPSNPLTNLLEQYNSESEDEGPGGSNPSRQLDKKVDDFLKEIQYIAPKSTDHDNVEENNVVNNVGTLPQSNAPLWQELVDESTGYPYYWHTETNQVTWEKPKELVLNQTSNLKKTNLLPRPPYDLQRNFSSNSYPEMQANIPEGMIPKEVVARNRNRLVNLSNKSKLSLKTKSKATFSDTKDDDINDGQIEMITSFGSDGTDDSDESTEEILKEEKPKLNSVDIKPVISSIVTVDQKKRKGVQMGPSLPEFQSTLNERTILNSNDIDMCANENHNLTENEKFDSDEIRKNPIKTFDNEDLKFSLVPGYADDSDNEEDLSKVYEKQTLPKQPLFPISDYSEKTFNPLILDEKTQVPIVDSVDTFADESQGSIKPEDKMNKFFECSELPTKAFQRKRRIAFDVMPDQNRIPDSESNEISGSGGGGGGGVIGGSNSSRDSNSSNSNSSANHIKSELIRSNEERLGFGFSKQPSSTDLEKSSTDFSPIEENSTNVSIDKFDTGINFVRGETLNLTHKPDQSKNEIDNSERIAIKKETETVLEKLKFLSEGSQAASAVQIMTVQLQTLLGAWEAGDLQKPYLDKWLQGTSRELSRLEKAVAPPGWDCQWDRSHKQYYYRNDNTNETRWNYPDVIGGAEEMELCNTPPPPMEQDGEDLNDDKSCELHREVMLDKTEDKSKNAESDKEIRARVDHDENDENKQEKKDSDSNKNVLEDSPVPPPPPQISSPSPPPPPRIYADDLKQGKKRRANEPYSSLSTSIKKDKIDSEVENYSRIENTMKNIQQTITHPLVSATRSEPLPPGVDSPEISYPMTGGQIEPTVIFAATPQQANASMYAAATLQDPTNVSIIGHHHPALLQSQLVHYPAYHQHLHNQAILAAAANHLTGQDTVQYVLDFPRIYTNTQVIAKPPIKTNNETLGSALDSFYSDIASLERQPAKNNQIEVSQVPKPQYLIEPTSCIDLPTNTTFPTISGEAETSNDAVSKDKKKKKAKMTANKKQKQVSSMVAKWQKAQNYENTN